MAEMITFDQIQSQTATIKSYVENELDKTGWQADGVNYNYGKIYKNVTPEVVICGFDSTADVTISSDNTMQVAPYLLDHSQTTIYADGYNVEFFSSSSEAYHGGTVWRKCNVKSVGNNCTLGGASTLDNAGNNVSIYGGDKISNNGDYVTISGGSTISNNGGNVAISFDGSSHFVSNDGDYVSITNNNGTITNFGDTINNNGNNVTIKAVNKNGLISNSGYNVSIRAGNGQNTVNNSGNNVKIDNASQDSLNAINSGDNVTIACSVATISNIADCVSINCSSSLNATNNGNYCTISGSYGSFFNNGAAVFANLDRMETISNSGNNCTIKGRVKNGFISNSGNNVSMLGGAEIVNSGDFFIISRSTSITSTGDYVTLSASNIINTGDYANLSAANVTNLGDYVSICASNDEATIKNSGDYVTLDGGGTITNTGNFVSLGGVELIVNTGDYATVNLDIYGSNKTINNSGNYSTYYLSGETGAGTPTICGFNQSQDIIYVETSGTAVTFQKQNNNLVANVGVGSSLVLEGITSGSIRYKIADGAEQLYTIS